MNKLAALPIRRKASEERYIYDDCSQYNPFDYEILLRRWPADPHLNYLAAFSGPIIEDNVDLGSTLMQQFYQWSKQLAILSGHSEEKGIKGDCILPTYSGGKYITRPGLKSIFLAPVHTCNKLVQDKSGSVELQFLSYIIPITNSSSTVASMFPTDNTRFPQFFCLGQILNDMYSKTIDIHPATREMLALLNIWLSQQHQVPHSLNHIFQYSCDKRINTVTRNPLHYDRDILRVSNDYYVIAENYANLPVDSHAVNPYYGTDIKIIDKPDMQLVNQFYGMGEPDYHAIDTSPSKWVIIPPDSDWTKQYPVHKAACESNVGAICRWVRRGRLPDELDGDGWSPLHYACWYGELEAVKALIKDCSADTEIYNTAGGSTPLHFAASKGWSEIVDYLLFERQANSGALDSDGRSPLAVCLESKENDWKNTEQMLRQAYKEQFVTFEPPEPTMFDVQFPTVNAEPDEFNDLGIRGRKPPRKERSPTIVRTNIVFMDGYSALAVFQNGKGTPALDGLQVACNLIDLGLDYQFVFALWIVSKSLAIQLGDTDKPLKLMEKWPILMERYSECKNEIASIEMRRNVFFPATKEKNVTDTKALEFLYHDAKYSVLKGCYSCTEEESIDLAAIIMQLKHGDYNSVIHVAGFLKDQLSSFVPYYHITKKSKVYIERQILTRYRLLSELGHSNNGLYQKYLNICRKWPFYGSTFYDGQMTVIMKKSLIADMGPIYPPVKPGRKHTLVRIGINNLGFHIINKSTNVYLQSYSLETMVWDMSKENHTFTLQDKSKQLIMTFLTKQAPLLHSLATEMDNQLMIYKKSIAKQKITRVRTKS